ncbi:hypothetical protein GY21_18550 [Cryobacterium roopkundense]|uniref:Acetyltransferase-like isoleucine patch superfamily enzyme n=1 Tax=Cryobacterium roopkundense TaxID=1001240 RepID=A0A099J1E4_9MICO|nr:acyltransferase [Cryobacterium roopkundense]KGJ71970.1 hypothetical protein GY21_18550 [Cryobacterium roopkundense]MBB5642802.1 acetyltransferase-like isoleucine patch superfamily enzyme [Cryobacterium roopkundense]
MTLLGRVRRVVELARGSLSGHHGVRIAAGVKLGGPGRYHLDRGSRIHRGVRIWVGPGATLALARGGGIGARTVINVESGLTIGTGSQVSWDAQILDTDFHRITGTDGTVLPHTIAVAIGDHVLVGTGALILKGVVIGDGAVVAAGSVVTSSVAAATIVAGNPARAISRLERWD